MDGLLGVLVASVVSELVVFVSESPAWKRGMIHPQTSNPRSTSSKARHLCWSVRQTQTSEFMRRP